MAIEKREKRPFGALSGPYLLTAYLAGVVAIYVGERLIGGEGRSRFTVSGLGGALATLSCLIWIRAWWASKGPARTVERFAALLAWGGLLSLAVYVLSSDIVNGPTPVVQSREAGLGLRQLLSAIWPVGLACTLLPLIFVQWSAASMAKGKGVEPFRARASARAGATIAALLCTLFFVNAVANRKDVHANLSYFKAALPSEYTRDLVASMEEETEALLFFPEVSEVREAARPFFEALDKLSGKFRVTLVDPAMAPEVARQHRVTQDGTVVIARGTNSEKLVLGDTMDAARGKLRSLDAELQKMVLKLTVERKTVYVISGHGERPESTSEEDPRPPLGALTKILKSSNMSVKKLGPVEGLGGGVPEDAAMIVWTDPSLPPFPGETEAITDYLDAGGRMLLTLDPSSDVDLKGLLDHLGLRYSRTLLANDKAYIPIKRVPTDKHYLITTAFSSHPAVGSFSRQKGVVPVFFPGVGSLQKNAGAKPKITFAVRAPSGTWGDDNGDGVRGEGETPGSFNLVAAVSAKTQKKGAGGVTREPLTEEMRVVVLADTDLLSDEYIGFRIGVSGMPGNLRLLADSLEWLVGQGQVAPATEGEEDVRIAHTRDEDVFWFYVTIFAVPLLILGLGVITRWGRGRGRRAK